MSSELKPAHAVGEFLGNIDHHIDHVQSLTGKVEQGINKAEKVVGGSFKENVKTGAVIARKGLRTGAKVAEVTALPAAALGLATGNAGLVEYGEMAPLVGEGMEVAADVLGATIKTL